IGASGWPWGFHCRESLPLLRAAENAGCAPILREDLKAVRLHWRANVQGWLARLLSMWAHDVTSGQLPYPSPDSPFRYARDNSGTSEDTILKFYRSGKAGRRFELLKSSSHQHRGGNCLGLAAANGSE